MTARQARRPVTVWLAILVALCGTLLGAMAISGESVWIDEAHTAEKAGQPAFAGWLHLMAIEDGSDAQMPLYMLSMWLWGQLVGTHPEALLRASNILWLLLGQGALCLALRPWPRWMLSSAFILAIHPFVWFYMDEARPYMMQLAAALLIAGFFIRRFVEPHASSWWGAAFGAGLVLLCGSSMLGALWAGAALLLCLIARKDLALGRREWGMIGGAVALLIALGGYFVWTLLRNAKPTVGETNLLNLAFAAYELLGCAGFGPGREEIRLQGIAAFKARVGALLPGAAAISAFSLAGLVWAWRNLPRRAWIVVALWTAPVMVLFVLSAANQSRLLGRHLTPVFPLFVLLAAGGAVALLEWMKAEAGARIAAVSAGVLALLGGAFAFSSYEIRFAGRHAKDDYRAAAAIAKSALDQGKTVWWCANPQGAHYYGLATSTEPATGSARFVRSPNDTDLIVMTLPDVLVLSRPDVYDAAGAIAASVTTGSDISEQRMPGFSVWDIEGKRP